MDDATRADVNGAKLRDVAAPSLSDRNKGQRGCVPPCSHGVVQLLNVTWSPRGAHMSSYQLLLSARFDPRLSSSRLRLASILDSAAIPGFTKTTERLGVWLDSSQYPFPQHRHSSAMFRSAPERWHRSSTAGLSWLSLLLVRGAGNSHPCQQTPSSSCSRGSVIQQFGSPHCNAAE